MMIEELLKLAQTMASRRGEHRAESNKQEQARARVTKVSVSAKTLSQAGLFQGPHRAGPSRSERVRELGLGSDWKRRQGQSP
jgi:hypothetical protein